MPRNEKFLPLLHWPEQVFYTSRMRFTAFSYELQPDPEQEAKLWRHAGAARFAYNQGLAMRNRAYEAHKTDPSVKVPHSQFDLINAFNRWKISAEAGNEGGRVGLFWQREVCAQVFEEGLTDLSRALKRFFDSRKSGGRKSGFPRFKKRGRAKVSFRMRNKRDDVRVSERSVRLPRLGDIPVRGSTRRLRRILRLSAQGGDPGKVLFATVQHTGGRWYVRFNVEGRPLHPGHHHKEIGPPIGIDRGLNAFVVAAKADGSEVLRTTAPKPLQKHLRQLRRLSRHLSKCTRDSKNRARWRRKIGRLHARIAFIRKDYLHNLSSHVAKTHSHVALEDLHVAGMVQNRCLARSIHDVGWSMFAAQLRYKMAWRTGVIFDVDRYYPSTKTCHRCQWRIESMPLSARVFACSQCGLKSDRDQNAAANCARLANLNRSVAVKQMDTLNAWGDGGSGRALIGAVKPTSMKQEKPPIACDWVA